MKTYLIILFFFISNISYSQYLSYHKTSLFGTKYFIDEVKVNKAQFFKSLESNSSSKKLYLESKKYKNYSTYCNVAQWVMVALQINEAFDNDTDYGYRYLGANVAFGIGTVLFKDKSNSFFRQSVDKYNRNKLDIGVSYFNNSSNIVGIYVNLN